jgi:hypothetical protein
VRLDELKGAVVAMLGDALWDTGQGLAIGFMLPDGTRRVLVIQQWELVNPDKDKRYQEALMDTVH